MKASKIELQPHRCPVPGCTRGVTAFHGLPSVEDAETFLARAKALAHSLARYQLQQKYLGIKDTLAHLKIKDTVPLLEWAAKQHGVDLFGESKH